MKEFTEFTNPESKDYDILSSNDETIKNGNHNPYEDILINMVGFLEDGEWEQYGLSTTEYFNPTKETIIKVQECLKNQSGLKR